MSGHEGYVPVACSFHDELEAAVVRRTVCRVRWRAADRAIREAVARLADVFASEGAEFLELGDGTTIRLDRLLEVRPDEEASGS